MSIIGKEYEQVICLANLKFFCRFFKFFHNISITFELEFELINSNNN